MRYIKVSLFIESFLTYVKIILLFIISDSDTIV